jgi:RNA polymerase sigma factor (sigma-70 family)
MNSPDSLFESLYEMHFTMVRQMCMGFMKGDRALASDLTQDVFINIWNALPSFKGQSTHKTWIYRITVNTCLQYLRKEKHTTKVAITENFDVSDESGDLKNDHDNTLYQAIGQLGEIDRLIIMMVLDELSYDEIARIVGIEAVNLRVRIHRIKKRLKEIIEHG